ncbi:MAG: peptide chain release factor N(5)-glutamine methyltransferase [Deltaproteobacteria bacterium]|nr:peptide chain release factor N(5)-glutamine methyltransferase [Deltaproteobacteria bacterium]
MTLRTWCIKALLETATAYLVEKRIESARLNAEVLLAYQLHVKRISLYLNFDQPLTEEEVSGYRNLIRRRLKHEPLQYITGVQEFWSLAFRVNPHVLIPRPETEILVEQAITLAGTFSETPLRVLDLGTGSGVISVTLAKEVPEALILATDISGEALGLARLNAQEHGVSDRITFLRGNLFEPLMVEKPVFHLIASNPPYVCTHEIQGLLPEVERYEPRSALDGGKDGMDFLKEIMGRAPKFLYPGGWLLLEMSPSQVEEALFVLAQTGLYQNETKIEDYSHRERVVMAQMKSNVGQGMSNYEGFLDLQEGKWAFMEKRKPCFKGR